MKSTKILSAVMAATMTVGGMAMPAMAQTKTSACKKAPKKKSAPKRKAPKKMRRAPRKPEKRTEVKGESYDKQSQYSSSTENGTVYSFQFTENGANANKTVYQTNTNYSEQHIADVKMNQAGPRENTVSYQKNDKTDKVDTQYQSDTLGIDFSQGVKAYQNSVQGQDGHDNVHASETSVRNYSVAPRR